jgi:hypothetical protein
VWGLSWTSTQSITFESQFPHPGQTSLQHQQRFNISELPGRQGGTETHQWVSDRWAHFVPPTHLVLHVAMFLHILSGDEANGDPPPKGQIAPLQHVGSIVDRCFVNAVDAVNVIGWSVVSEGKMRPAPTILRQVWIEGCDPAA